MWFGFILRLIWVGSCCAVGFGGVVATLVVFVVLLNSFDLCFGLVIICFAYGFVWQL